MISRIFPIFHQNEQGKVQYILKIKIWTAISTEQPWKIPLLIWSYNKEEKQSYMQAGFSLEFPSLSPDSLTDHRPKNKC